MARDLLRTPVIGVVENMTSYVCPTCGSAHPLFAQTSEAASALGIPLLGRVPFDPRMAAAGDRGVPYLIEHAASQVGQALWQVGERVQTFLGTVSPAPERSPVR
jgi:ATP-binding protein involved in chromosome partitioning